MTTGNTGEIWRIGPVSSYRYGDVRAVNWSGGDAIDATHPRSSYPKVSEALGPRRARANYAAILAEIDSLKKERDRLAGMLRRHARRERRGLKQDLHRIRQKIRRVRKALAYVRLLREKAIKDEVERRRRASEERRKFRRLLPPKPFTKTFYHQVTPGVIGRHTSWSKTIPDALFASGAADYFPVVNSTYVDKLPQDQRNKLLAKLQRKAYGSGFNPVVFLAEGRQALDMIFSAATSIANALSAVRHGNLRAACFHLGVTPSGVRSRELWYKKEMSDRWLELQYGWLPLLSDVKEGAQFLAEAAEQPQKYRTKLVGRRVYAVYENYRGTEPRYYASRVNIVSHQIIIYNFSKAPTGVGLWGVAEAAWEKLPWSFVCDWFVPVGELLRSLKTASQISGTVVETYKVDSVYLNPTSQGSGYTVRSTALPIGESLERTYMRRTVTDEVKPIQSTEAVLGSISNLKEAMSWRRASNAVALLTQRAFLRR